jgi:hypothetical protein
VFLIDAISNGASISVWLAWSGLGVMLGNFAAVAARRSPEERAEWSAFGGAAGCVIGLCLICLGSIVTGV